MKYKYDFENELKERIRENLTSFPLTYDSIDEINKVITPSTYLKGEHHCKKWIKDYEFDVLAICQLLESIGVTFSSDSLSYELIVTEFTAYFIDCLLKQLPTDEFNANTDTMADFIINNLDSLSLHYYPFPFFDSRLKNILTEFS